MAKEVFKNLTFTYFGGERERNVDAQVVAIIDSPSAIDLKLTFELKVDTVKRLTSKLVVNIQ